MEHGVNTNLLRTWIAAYQRQSAQVSAGEIARTQDAAFVAVHVEANGIRLSASVRWLFPR